MVKFCTTTIRGAICSAYIEIFQANADFPNKVVDLYHPHGFLFGLAWLKRRGELQPT